MGYKKLHAVVSGMVQGVGFRFYVKYCADRIGITGSVENLPDNRVEVYAWGHASEIENFLQDLRQGPPMAEVDQVDSDITDSEIPKKGSFQILRDRGY